MRRRSDGGVSLVEVLVAVAILEVGLVGTVGVLTIAHRTLTQAERLHQATQAAVSAADSLLGLGIVTDGSADAPWGRLRWAAAAGGVAIIAEERSGPELLNWWIPFPRLADE